MTYPSTWYERLDDWQHGHTPSTPQLDSVWWQFWRPLCDYTDRKIWERHE